ncbi:MaoC family dehydratase [Gluconacetobacter sacchari]|uniref:MaoC family dehydratase n=2 Tax=Gluconacetobacter sacchari TaxID=92759 RepID=A0A7W4NRS5_9PROT|nr:MaoC family dehydratase [Gluconacetobacter sacchari]MBB2160485.1 MaoC family dehydratase [Gluconacetobacter sacchari]
MSTILSFDEGSVRDIATLIGDTNPLHHDAAVAKASRFGHLIASGGHCAAMMLGGLAGWLTERDAAVGLDFAFWFRKAVPAGCRARLTWRIVAIQPKDSLKGHLLTLEGVLDDGEGDRFITASSTALAGPPPAVTR